MPSQCPKNKINYYDCILCSDNRDGYCWGLCPPKECKQPINDILTIEERLAILEDRFENHDYLEKEELKSLEIEERLVYLEELSYKLETRLQTFHEIESKYNSMYDTLNNSLSYLSKKIVNLEESSKSKGIKHRFNEYT